jgi:hypothetical protein
MSNYALQAEVPDVLRGRVFATDMMIVTLAISVSQLAAGAVVDHVSPRVLIAAFGTVTLVYAVVWRLVTSRVMRRTRPDEAAAADATSSAPVIPS